MKPAKIAQAKDNFSKYLSFVKKGGRVRVLDHGTPVAELVAIPSQAASDDEALLDSLERRGVIKRGSGEPFPEDFFEPGPPDPKGEALASFLEERRRGR